MSAIREAIYRSPYPHVPDRRVISVGPDYVLYERGNAPKVRRMTMKNWLAWMRENRPEVIDISAGGD